MTSIEKEPELEELRQRRLAYFNHSTTLNNDVHVCENMSADRENNKKTLHHPTTSSAASPNRNKSSKTETINIKNDVKIDTESMMKLKSDNSHVLGDKTAKDVVNSKLYAQRLSEKPETNVTENYENLYCAERPLHSYGEHVDLDGLGLSTHRPDINAGPPSISESVISDDTTLHRRLSSTGAAGKTVLEDTIGDVQLRELLGEDKYQEFLEKSRKDIEALKVERKSSPGRPVASYADSCVSSIVQIQPKLLKTSTANGSQSKEYSERPKLNRPKDAPALVTNTLIKSRHDLDREVPQAQQLYGTKNYEQTNVSRNVAYSSNEIYHQAFRDIPYNNNPYLCVNGPWQAVPPMVSPRHFVHMAPNTELMYGYNQHLNHPEMMYHGQPLMMYNSPTPPGSPAVQFSPHPPIYPASNHPVNFMQGPHPSAMSYPALQSPVSHMGPHPSAMSYPAFQSPVSHMGPHPSAMSYPALQSPVSHIGRPIFIPYPQPPRDLPRQQSTTTSYQSSPATRHDARTTKLLSPPGNNLHELNLNQKQSDDCLDVIPHPPTEDKLSTRRPHREHIEGVRQFHESRRRALKVSPELEPSEQFAVDRLEKYFSSVEDYFLRLDGTETSDVQGMDRVGLAQPRDASMDAELETLVASTITNLKAGGVTERLRDLGIEIPFLKAPLNVEEMKLKTDSAQADPKPSTSSKPKEAKICTECGSMNKSYMSWCASCGEILIGVEVTLIGSERSHLSAQSRPDLHALSTADLQSQPRSDPHVQLICDQSTQSRYDILADFKSDPRSYKEGEDSGFDDKVSPSKPKSQGNGEDERHKHTRRLSSRALKIDMAEAKDSGRAPSSGEEREVIQQRGKTQKEIVDICESIGDPVIRGFLKSYLSKRSLGTDTSTKQKKSLLSSKKKTKRVNSIQNQTKPELEHVTSSQYQVPGDGWSPTDSKVSAVNESIAVSCNGHPIPLLDLGFSSDDDDKRKILDISLTTDEDDDDFEVGQGDAAIHQLQEYTEQVQNVQYNQLNPDIPTEQTHSYKSRTHSSANRNPIGNSSSHTINAKGPVHVSDRATIPPRHWMRSSIAWSTYSPGELNKQRSSPHGKNHSKKSDYCQPRRSFNCDQIDNQQEVKSQNSQPRRPASASVQRRKVTVDARPESAGFRKRTSWEGQRDINLKSRTQDIRKILGDFKTTCSSENNAANLPQPSRSCDIQNMTNLDEVVLLPTGNKSLSSPVKASPTRPTGSQMALSAYDMYHSMTPRISDGSFSVWLCLPDELLLFILSHLSISDLSRCAQVCKHFYRVTMDQSLWRSISLSVRHHLTDNTLEVIGQRQPISLSLIQCHGSNVSADGLQRMFQLCGSYLEELNISRCSRGALVGDNVLQQASIYCKHLTHLDISWTHVTNTGLSAISSTAIRLESVSLNGCQSVSNQGLEHLLKKHGKSLRVLELFGCFNINQAGIRGIGQNCHNLLTLNLGQCYKVTDSSIMEVTSSLPRLQSLDLRGCKQVRDNSVRRIVKNCPRLNSIALANCPHISDVAVSEIATYLKHIRWIDVCGCKNITDESLKALTKNCPNLSYIDIGSTGCTRKSVLALASQCSDRLEVVKLNFLSDIDETSVLKLVKNSSSLRVLQLYGCKGLQIMANKLKKEKPTLSIEM